ncbi:MAG: hypothetical protein KC776_11520 [Myxococcales bacterium]|nr:hypothetical protein [Myxococcales bacterium]
MLRRLSILLLAAAVVCMATSFAESAENVVHLALHGDMAHSADGHHQSAEHGCAGGVHVCPCCAHLPAATLAFSLDLTAPADGTRLSHAHRSSPRDGSRSSVYRPPVRA